MSGDAFKPVHSGERVRLSADAWNRMLRLSADAPYAERLGPRVGQAAPCVLIRNDSGSDLGRFGVLGIDDAIWDPAANPADYQGRIALSGITPTLADHADRFAIVPAPLPDGAIGPAVLTGLTMARVDVTDASHTRATVKDNGSASLASAGAGYARILWKESGTGLKWAVIRLGNPALPGWYKVKEEFNDYVRARSWDGASEGTEDVYIAKPRECRHVITPAMEAYSITSLSTTNAGEISVAAGSTVEDWVYSLPYAVDSLIWAAAVDNDPVTIAGGDKTTLTDLNQAGRQWAVKPT